MLHENPLACFARKFPVIERCSTYDGIVGRASHRQERWHTSQEGPEDCKEGSQYAQRRRQEGSGQGKVNCKADQEQGRA